MKITSIQTSNFLGARAVDVRLSKPIVLFAGKNYSGKSSLQEAVRMAITGESVRVALKKDYGALVTEGQESGFAEVAADGESFSVILPSGKGVHSGNAELPYVLDAQRFARLDPNERRAFLFGLMNLKTDGAAVKDRLTARGCDSAKIELVMPLLRAGFEAACKEAQARARDAKAAWRTVTGETYGDKKAPSYRAEKPEVNASALHAAKIDLEAIEHEIETETGRLGDLQGRAKQAAERDGKLEGLRQQASLFARIQEKLNRDEAELKEWEEKVETLRKSRKSQDALPCPGCGAMLVLKDGELVHAAPMAVGTEDDIDRLPDYEKALRLMQSTVANDRRDLEASNSAARAMRELEDAGLVEAPSESEISALKTRIEILKASRKEWQCRIAAQEDAQRRAEQADHKTDQAAKHHSNVQAWSQIADALAPDGIPGEMLAEALEPINKRLGESADIAEWQRVCIAADMRIMAGDRDYALLSESEKWRTDAMIACAIAKLSGVRLLVLDRFDVLDLSGREDLLYWLAGMAIDGDIDTALIFGTLKGLPAQLPEPVQAVWIESGVSGQIEEVA